MDRVWHLSLIDTLGTNIIKYEVGTVRISGENMAKLTQSQFRTALRQELDLLIFDIVNLMYDGEDE